MKLTVRRVGNSLGVLIPKAALAAWGVVEGARSNSPNAAFALDGDFLTRTWMP